MATLPGSIIEDIQWIEQRLSTWSELAPQIGLTAEQTNTMTTETTEARGAFDGAQAAKNAAMAATQVQNIEVSEMRTLAHQLIKTVRAFAITQPDPGAVLALALIPPKADPTAQPPAQPFDVTYDLDDNGSIELKWKGNTHGGTTVFSILRAVQTEPGEPTGPLTQVGLTGVRTFTDTTLPLCTIQAQYVIKAYKGAFTPAGSIPITVRFTSGADVGDQSMRFVA